MSSQPGPEGQAKQATSPFSLFKPISWAKGGKKVKQAKLGEENNMYYHPELKRWVERGKEDEAAAEAAGPPPPPVLSGGSIAHPGGSVVHKRSLSQRYVLQSNLSVSSMGSLTGSLSQTDLAGMAGQGGGDPAAGSFSRTPSGYNSTGPSPPLSGSGLPPSVFAPGANTGASAGPAANFFVPAPPQRSPSTGFFVPPAPVPQAAGGDGDGEVEAQGETGEQQFEHSEAGATEISLGQALPAAPADAEADADSAMPVSAAREPSYGHSLSFSDALRVDSQQLDSPNGVVGPRPLPEPGAEADGGLPVPHGFEPGLRSVEHGHSDGGAAVSLYNGIAPGAEVEAEADGQTPPALQSLDEAQFAEHEAGAAAEAEQQLQTDGGSSGGAVAMAVDGYAGQEASTSTDPADAASATPASASPGDAASQYYYQQYAYLYQYALSQGYAEADAVTYAQYYATQYAQQYTQQAPAGQLGEGEGQQEQQEQQQEVAIGLQVVSGGDAEGGEGQEAAADGSGWEVELPELAVGSATAVEEPEPEAPQQQDQKQEEQVQQVAMEVEQAYAHEAVATTAAPGQQQEEQDEQPLVFTPAPLPEDLTAAACAAAQHHQSAVTAAVAAAAAAATAAAASQPAQPEAAQRGAPASATVSAPHVAAASGGVSTAPQVQLLGRLGKLASSAVTSLGASAAAAAAAVAAPSAPSSALSLSALGLVGSFGELSSDDFDCIMHPGDPAKLDGPLPWELPEHLRHGATGRKLLALCSNWQRENPGKHYTPALLQQLLEAGAAQEQEQGGEGNDAAAVAAEAAADGLVVVASSDVALAAEGGCGSRGANVAEDASAAEPEAGDGLSSYERACRLSQFGLPATELLQPHKPQQPAAPALQTPKQMQALTHSVAVQQQQQQQQLDQVAEPAASAVEFAVAQEARTQAPSRQVPLQVDIVMALQAAVTQSPGELPTPTSARSDDPFSGTEHLPRSYYTQHQQHHEQQQDVQEEAVGGSSVEKSPQRVYAGAAALGLEEMSEEERELEEVASPGTVPVQLAALGEEEAADFFAHLGEEPAAEVQPELSTAAAVEAEAAEEPAAAAASTPAYVVEEPEYVVEEPAADVIEEPAVEAAEPVAPAAAAAAAAAIDSVVAALEQLRSSAAATADSEGESAEERTALLQQIHASLASATAALAGMGVDISALAALAGAAPVAATSPDHTPGPGHKRPRKDDSPATPTRPTVVSGTVDAVETPLLAPGPMLVRGAEGDDVATPALVSVPGPGERFQQLGRALSNARADVAQSQPQPPAVVVSLNVVAAPEVDVSVLEARVRGEERQAWESKLAAVVDSERDAASLVIASVEQQRDELQSRLGGAEAALAEAEAGRSGLVAQLEVEAAARRGLEERVAGAEAAAEEARRAAAEARAEAEAARAAAAAAEAERDAMSVELAAERTERESLAAALSAAREESSSLRSRYKARFAALSSELEATRGSLCDLQSEHDELLLCLGQESTKVEALAGAVREAGGDPEPIIEAIEAEYETMGLGGGGGSGADSEAADVGAGEEQEAAAQEVAAAEAALLGGGEGWDCAELELEGAV
ncbi:hypothetical protein CHLRE_17g740750v5 [Chlamydomonas reinhardtii]|uniref:Uncharacterized protein n=1 Tax=Chlamydomonas reinhardtii TaxID=3055 RepID=A0A2K3CRQ9_CHLRE|nr:uncharacterized protein CHLRE_17g740750v5 [Chlamydomonas reinhardtii]PNW70965.1 hypothetical protein CHLRE_17g740750v5 [Chlamydomonas reinhardtii]